MIQDNVRVGIVGDSLLYTPDGKIPIKELVGVKEVDVYCRQWNKNIVVVGRAHSVQKTKIDANNIIEVNVSGVNRIGLLCLPHQRIYTNGAAVAATSFYSRRMRRDSPVLGVPENCSALDPIKPIVKVRSLRKRPELFDVYNLRVDDPDPQAYSHENCIINGLFLLFWPSR